MPRNQPQREVPQVLQIKTTFLIHQRFCATVRTFMTFATVPLGIYFLRARSTPFFQVLILLESRSNPPTSLRT